jgi:hypothetical protein
MTVQIRPEAASFPISDVELLTIRLNGTVPADTASAKWGDAKKDSIPDLTLKFARDAVAPLLVMGINRIDVSGSLKTGEIFRGFADLRLLPSLKDKVLTSPLRMVSLPGAIPVVLAVAGIGTQRTFAVYDVQGRLVTRWRTTVGAAGSVAWDGRGSDGRRIGSGIYLVRAEDGAHGRALKIIITR